MGPKKGRRNVRKEVPTDTPKEFEFGDTEADGGRENRGRGEVRRARTPQSHTEEGVAKQDQ